MKIRNNIGLTFEFLENGSIKNIEAENIRLNLKPGTPFSKEISSIYLRKRSPEVASHPLFGQGSNSHFTFIDDKYVVKGSWDDIHYTCILQLSPHSYAWKWNIEISNQASHGFELDLVYFQEVGLKNAHEGLVNEYYVSQYLERMVLQDAEHGAVIACRQNNKEVTGHPWLMLASLKTASTGLTDGMQFYGNSHRATGKPIALTQKSFSGNKAGESPLVAIQEKPFILNPNQKKQVALVGIFLPNHAEATSDKDLKWLKKLQEEFPNEAIQLVENNAKQGQANLFNQNQFLPVLDLDEKDIENFFGKNILHKEWHNNQWLSFFTADHHHVVSKQKEMLVDRPHAHILQSQLGFIPNENVMSTTCFATGVFNSHISQGNTNFNVLLSINTSQFNANLESGQRIFVKYDDQHFLLGIPSAFEMGLDFCRWIYKHENGIIEVVTKTFVSQPVVETTFKVLEGKQVEIVVSHDFDKTNTWQVHNGLSDTHFNVVPTDDSMIKSKFPQAQFQFNVEASNLKSSLKYGLSAEAYSIANGLFVLETEKTNQFSMQFVGEVVEKFNQMHTALPENFWDKLRNGLQLNGSDTNIKAIQTILPWYGMNAMTHFLTPYGLEQFSGAAWGTRDVSQGPIELLLALEKYEAAKKVLLTLFANQNTFGDWPQWWMFDSYQHIRAGDCHGDIYYWVMIALANYIKTTGDTSILAEKVTYFKEANHTTVQEHIDRLTQMIVDSYINGTSLVPFGGGDWNDSLQPVNEELAKRLISSWTVEMNYQAFSEMKEVYRIVGNKEKENELDTHIQNIQSDFNSYLMKDGVVAGYGYVEDNGDISVLLHPSDTKTGIKYSLLPMNRGIISGIFTKEQGEAHQPIIDQYLQGPDGARLMDKPLRYKGGIQEIFQRAESSTFFGREIGLMYIHEHIRYAESQAVLGKADAFIKALRQAIPVNYQDVVKQGNMRQANCYYSSSDVTFSTRYEADYKYQEVLDGKMTLDGGWRVYSSGPGIYISLIIKKLIGFRADSKQVIFDPVLTKEMNGLEAMLNYQGFHLKFKFNIEKDSFCPKQIKINGNKIHFELENNPFRNGGAILGVNDFKKLLIPQANLIEITL